jgi:streptomycin 6-kinase
VGGGAAADLAAAWGLELEEPFASPHSLVVPAGDVVLKVNEPWHFEAEFEADALAVWDGNGAVRLLRHDRERRALLVERCRPGTRLGHDGIDVVCELLPRLWVEAGAPFRRLVDEARRWEEEVPQRPGIERGLLDRAVAVYRSAVDAPSLVNQDLHGENVLLSERGWLVIDPKPLVGERELGGASLLRNAAREGGTRAVVRWLDALAELGLDRERLRDWGVAHSVAWENLEEARTIRDAGR